MAMSQDGRQCQLMILGFKMQQIILLKSIQQRSNSLYPYDLLEILLAKAKVAILY
jgi:hypothetical protein